LGDKILRFHVLKEKKEIEYDRMKKKKIVEKEFDDGFDSDDDELMN
jgi:hypothetical protein